MKVLFITGCDILGNTNFGGAQCSKRNFHLIQQYFGEENTYLCLFNNESRSEMDRVKVFPSISSRIGAVYAAFLHYKVYMPGLQRQVREYIEEIDPDIVYLETSLFGVLKKAVMGRKTIVFMQNIERDYAAHKVTGESIVYLPSFIASRWNEKKTMTFADMIIALNEKDARRIKELYGRETDYLLPITLEDSFSGTTEALAEKPNELLFVGSFFGPNYDGIKWFINEVMPSLQEYHLVIVGKGFEKVKDRLERNNVSVVGTVDDLSECYKQYPVVVMPILYGDGMKVKTCEAMMYGKAILATDIALEGYDVSGLSMIKRCNTAQQFVDAILDIDSNEKIKIIHETVRQRYLDKYDSQKVVPAFIQFLDNWLESNM